MGLQFILGGAGAGKTEYILRYFLQHAGENYKKNWYLVVPEQDTLTMQREIVGHPCNQGRGILNIDVLSFDRLAYRVFEELQIPPFNIIDDVGKVMILRQVAEREKNDLVLYGSQLNRPGFLDELKSQISELYQYRVMPEDLDAVLAQPMSDYSKGKIQDLKLLYAAFRNEMEKTGRITQEELLERLYHYLPESEFLRDQMVAFDGFTGFTPVQLSLMEVILRQADSVWVTGTVSQNESDTLKPGTVPEQLFYLTGQTLEKLTKCAGETHTEVLPPIDLNRYDAISGEPRGEKQPLPRFVKIPGLELLEKGIYRYGQTEKMPDRGGADGIEIWEAADLRQEIRSIAAEIRQQASNGMRYRDMGIILTEPEMYRDIVYQVFHEAEIPYYFDDPQRLTDQPLAEMLRSALEAADRGFTFDSVMRYLRSLPVNEEERHDIDMLENHIRTEGIRRIAGLQESWSVLEAERKRYLEPLVTLYDQISGKGKTVGERISALRVFMESIAAGEKTEILSEDLTAIGETHRAKVIEKGKNAIMHVLEQLEQTLGDAKVSRREFSDIFDAGLNEASVRVIPAAQDQVQIGDLQRSRFNNPKIFFVAGLNADQVPKAESSHKILTDMDRAVFQRMHINLAPDRAENALVQRFYIYKALLNPTERLILSYPMRGRSGKGLKASGLIQEIRTLLPDVRTEKLRFKKRDISTWQDVSGCTAELLGELVKTGPDRGRLMEAAALLKLISGSERYGRSGKNLIDAALFHYLPETLPAEQTEALYGKVISDSITRVEQFSRCAYAHFLRYGLNLREETGSEVKAVDLGNLYHDAIEACFIMAKEEGGLAQLDPELRDRFAEEAVDKAAEKLSRIKMLESARNRYMIHKIKRIMKRTMSVLQQQLNRGSFTVADVEKKFEHLGQGIRLKGRIDRVDLLQEQNRIYVRIVDYKSGNSRFELSKVYEGKQLQLPIYMKNVRSVLQKKHPEKEILPAAMLYYNIDDPVLEYDQSDTPEIREKKRMEALRGSGLVNSDSEVLKLLDSMADENILAVPVSKKRDAGNKKGIADTMHMTGLEKFAERKVMETAKQIRAGSIMAAPGREGENSDCEYCPYHSICGFDERLPGYHYRKAEKLDEDELWQRMLSEDTEAAKETRLHNDDQMDKESAEDY